MDVHIVRLPKSQVTLTIEVTPEELRPALQQAVQEISREVEIAGFRPGKAPYDIVVKRVGEMRVYQHAAEFAVADSFPGAVKQEKLTTVGQPEISVQKLAPGNPFVYTATVSVIPEIKLGNYKKIKVEKKTPKVDKKDVAEALHNIQKMHGTEARVQRAATRGDKVEVNLQIFRDSVPIDGGQAKNPPVIIGESNFIPGFEDHLINMKENEKKEFTLTFPKNYHQKDLASKDALFKVAVTAVYNITLPPIDDEFAKTVANLPTLDELKKRVEQNIKEEKKHREQQRYERALLEEIIGKSEFGELPVFLVNNELDRMSHELRHDVERRGMKYDNYLSSIKKTEESLRQEFLPEAEKRIKSALILREIGQKEGIEVTNEEIDRIITEEEKHLADQPEALKNLQTAGYRDYLRTITHNQKVITAIDTLTNNT